MNVYSGEVRNWNDLTPEQQASGDWIRLPQDAGPIQAQHEPGRGIIEKMFPVVKDLEGRRRARLEALEREIAQAVSTRVATGANSK